MEPKLAEYRRRLLRLAAEALQDGVVLTLKEKSGFRDGPAMGNYVLHAEARVSNSVYRNREVAGAVVMDNRAVGEIRAGLSGKHAGQPTGLYGSGNGPFHRPPSPWGYAYGPMLGPVPVEGRCAEGDRCVCGGDLPAVRAGCSNWRKS